MSSKIITELPEQTPKQRSGAVKEHELSECAANPHAPCRTAATDFMIKGYDDKFRCKTCNELHAELVMREAGESSPNTEPQFVAPKLDKRAQTERMARIEAMNTRLSQGSGLVSERGVPVDGQTRGPTGIPAAVTTRPLKSGEAADMRSAGKRDDFGTRDPKLSAEERRKRIMAKYGQKNGGSKML